MFINEITISSDGAATICGPEAHALWAFGKGDYPKVKTCSNGFYVMERISLQSHNGFVDRWVIRAGQTSREGAVRYMTPDRVLVDVLAAPAA